MGCDDPRIAYVVNWMKREARIVVDQVVEAPRAHRPACHDLSRDNSGLYEFDDLFEKYLIERFKPFRDKERPADYGRNLAPDPRTHFSNVLSIEASPSGDMIAAVVANNRDYELDVIVVSALDGQVIQNLTKGFDHTNRIEYVATAGGLRGNLVPWIAWAPVGDTVAYLARTGKVKSLMLVNVATGHSVKKLDLGLVDGPESPVFSPDGKRATERRS